MERFGLKKQKNMRNNQNTLILNLVVDDLQIEK